MKHRPRALLLLAAGILAAMAAWAQVRPSNDRNWKPDHARLPEIRIDGNRVEVRGVRRFEATSESTFVEAFEDRVYDLDRLESLWFVLSVFNRDGWRGPAHGMLSFGFSGGDYVVVSVEARKEVGESYSTWKGLLKRYEIIYVVGDERDLVRTRAVFRDDEVFLYPIRTTPEKIRELFTDMLRAAEDLHRRPRFYNTITNNCTTRLRHHVNRIAPGRIPPSWKVLLPGYSDELLEQLGLLDSNEPIGTARRKYNINERARVYRDDPEFSRKIREF